MPIQLGFLGSIFVRLMGRKIPRLVCGAMEGAVLSAITSSHKAQQVWQERCRAW